MSSWQVNHGYWDRHCRGASHSVFGNHQFPESGNSSVPNKGDWRPHVEQVRLRINVWQRERGGERVGIYQIYPNKAFLPSKEPRISKERKEDPVLTMSKKICMKRSHWTPFTTWCTQHWDREKPYLRMISNTSKWGISWSVRFLLMWRTKQFHSTTSGKVYKGLGWLCSMAGDPGEIDQVPQSEVFNSAEWYGRNGSRTGMGINMTLIWPFLKSWLR